MTDEAEKSKRSRLDDESEGGNWNRNLIVTKFNYFTVANWKINFDYIFSSHCERKFVFSLLSLKWKIIGNFASSTFPRSSLDARIFPSNDIWFDGKFDIRQFSLQVILSIWWNSLPGVFIRKNEESRKSHSSRRFDGEQFCCRKATTVQHSTVVLSEMNLFKRKLLRGEKLNLYRLRNL